MPSILPPAHSEHLPHFNEPGRLSHSLWHRFLPIFFKRASRLSFPTGSVCYAWYVELKWL